VVFLANFRSSDRFYKTHKKNTLFFDFHWMGPDFLYSHFPRVFSKKCLFSCFLGSIFERKLASRGSEIRKNVKNRQKRTPPKQVLWNSPGFFEKSRFLKKTWKKTSFFGVDLAKSLRKNSCFWGCFAHFVLKTCFWHFFGVVFLGLGNVRLKSWDPFLPFSGADQKKWTKCSKNTKKHVLCKKP
jgi:hypothetical protein